MSDKTKTVAVCKDINEKSRVDVAESLIEVFNLQCNSDDESYGKKGFRLVRAYVDNPEAVDEVLMTLCGWSMESLLEQCGAFNNDAKDMYSLPVELEEGQTVLSYLLTVAEKQGWTTQYDFDAYGNDKPGVDFGWCSPEGQDLHVTVEAPDDPEAFIHNLYEYHNGYDPDEEALIWAGSLGRNGVPGSLRDLVTDMEVCKKAIWDLAEALSAAYHRLAL